MHLGDNVVVMGGILHVARLALHVHQAHRHAQFGRGAARAVAAQRVNVVDHARTCGHGGMHHLRLGGVDGNRQGSARDQLLYHRQHATKLFLDRNLGGTWPSGFTADVEHVGTFVRHAQTLRHGGIDLMVQTVGGKTNPA